MALLVLFFSLFSSSKAEAPVVEHQIADDQWIEVPLDFTFPFYGNSYVTSFMFTNGVVGFLDPLDVPGSGYIHDGLCCSGQDFSSGATGVRFHYTIMPWHTDLIDTGAGRFYTQGDSTFQKYMWENLAEYYDAGTENSFDLTIFPLGNIEINYRELEIDDHSVTVAVVGDLSAGEYTQWFYNHPTQDGAIFWNSQEDDPVVISSGNSICSVVPDSHISCLYYPEAYALAVYNQNCAADALYDEGCPGWEELYYETYVEEEEPEVWETTEEEEVDTTYTFEEPEPYIELTFEPIEDYSVTTEVFETEMPEMEEFFEEVTQEDIMLELELEMEEFFDPLPEIEPEPVEEEFEELLEEPIEEEPVEETIEEPVEEEVDEPSEDEESEESTDEESEESTEEEVESTDEEPEEEESDEIMLAEAEPEEKVEEKKEESKKEKMKKIISNKLKSLAKEMGEASSLEAQKEIQAYILALLNFNAGFGSYSSSLVDGIFYEEKDIYSNKKIPENQRALRNGLANEILHNKLVELQWQK